MGLGLIIWGFMTLHFRFLDNPANQFFSLGVSLTFIILGFLYSYQKTHQKEYLYLITLGCMLIGVTFMENVRPLYLCLQTLLFASYLYFIQKQIPDYPYRKSYFIWLVLYVIAGFFKAITSLNGLWYQLDLNQFASYLLLIALIVELRHLWKFKKIIIFENQPQKTPVQRPVYIQLLVILLAIGLIVFTHKSLVQRSFQTSIQTDVYEITSEYVDVSYCLQYYVNYSNGSAGDLVISPYVKLKKDIKPRTLSFQFNQKMISKGTIEYFLNYDYYRYIESDRATFIYDLTQNVYVIIDGIKYPATIQEVHLDEYGYQDRDIKISHCLIKNQIVYTYPRIEFYNKDVRIVQMSIINQKTKEVISHLDLGDKHNYKDGISFFYELPTRVSQANNGPYAFVLLYHDQDNIIKKEYPLTLYEDNMS